MKSSNKKIIHFTIIMFLISSLLMITHNNAPMPLSAQYLWGPLSVLLIILLEPKILTNRLILINLFYFIAYGFILPHLLWNSMSDWYAIRQPTLFNTILFTIVIFSWLQKKTSIEDWKLYAKVGMIFIIITCIMTIIATELNPMVVRASYSSEREDIANFMLYRKLGIGSYGYMIALVLLFPPLIYLFKNSGRKTKLTLLILIAIIFYTLLQAQIFANILVAILIIILSVFGSENFKKGFIVSILLFIIIFILPKEMWARLFIALSSYFPYESDIYYKLNDITMFITHPEIVDADTGAGSRLVRYHMLWRAFIKAPFLGDASYYSPYTYELTHGGHLFWMSRLTLWGTIGFAFFAFLLYSNFKKVYTWLSKDFRFYYLLSIAAFVILGLIKALSFLESFVVLFIVIPGLVLRVESPWQNEIRPKKVTN